LRSQDDRSVRRRAVDLGRWGVPPAQSIRVHNFGDVTIPVAPWLIAMTPGSPGAFTIPADRFFDGNEADRRQWTAYAQLMGYTDVFAFLTTYFKGRLSSEWDTIFYRDIAPALFKRIVDNLIFSSTSPQKAPTPGGPMTAKVDPNTGLLLPNAQPYKGLSADFSTTSRYTGGTVRMTINVRGTSSIARQDVPPVMYLQGGGVLANLGDPITFRLAAATRSRSSRRRRTLRRRSRGFPPSRPQRRSIRPPTTRRWAPSSRRGGGKSSSRRSIATAIRLMPASTSS